MKMKVGDIVRVTAASNWRPGDLGLIVEEFKPTGARIVSDNNRGKAWRVLMPNGTIRPKLTKYLRLVEDQ
tara:strand:+ start:239 stop:448 length:210 start_codon:yes stop_codon:yes gene_type:complete